MFGLYGMARTVCLSAAPALSGAGLGNSGIVWVGRDFKFHPTSHGQGHLPVSQALFSLPLDTSRDGTGTRTWFPVYLFQGIPVPVAWQKLLEQG